METIQIYAPALAALILFLFAIDAFSKELQLTFNDQLKSLIGKMTNKPLTGVITGAITTAVLQSSSAVSVVCVSLISSGVMNLNQAVTIFIGSNIGTTITSQLIALKLTTIAPYLMMIGFMLNMVKNRYSVWGKSIFFFGLLFYGLYLFGNALSPLTNNSKISEILNSISNPYLGIITGLLITILFQSSSVFIGLTIVLCSENILSVQTSISLVLGSNIGTTTTAILASLSLNQNAKRAAIVNFLINFFGVLMYLPILYPFIQFIEQLTGTNAFKIANAHLIFNLTIALLTFIAKDKIIKTAYKFI